MHTEPLVQVSFVHDMPGGCRSEKGKDEVKTMKKRIFAIAAAAVMAASLAGCGNSSSTSSGTTSSSASAETESKADSNKVYHIGICQQMEHPSLDSATKGFEDELTKKLGKDHVDFDLQNAQGESANLSSICNTFVSSNDDLIMANATGSLQAAASATDSIPILGTSVTDYATALELDDFNGTTGKNISGTSDLPPLDQQEEMIKELVPDAKNVGILYCSAEPNSIFQAQRIEKYLKKDNISYKEYTCADSNDINSVVTKMSKEVDAVYIPSDNTIAASIETVKNILVPAKVPAITAVEAMCEAGVGTLSIDYYELGEQTADQAYDILVNGKDPSTMKVETAKKFTKMYNPENCKKLGIKVPDGYTEIESDSE